MRLTHLADYAVVILSAAARRPAGARLSAAVLSHETGVPLPTAQKLMGRLAVAGLLTGTRGQQGGYVLARTPCAISLAEIVEAVEGPIAMTQCSGSDEVSDCALDAHCRVKGHMGVVSTAVRGALDAVTLATLAIPPAHSEEGLSKRSLSKARLEGPHPVLRDAISASSMVPQDERISLQSAPQ